MGKIRNSGGKKMKNEQTNSEYNANEIVKYFKDELSREDVNLLFTF